MRGTTVPTALTVALLLISLPLCYHRFTSERAADAAALEQQQQLSEFQNLVGYGGLIHNFKNWVLRPDDEIYRDRALAQADEAVVVLEQLEASIAGHPAELDAAFETIRSYQVAIDWVGELHRWSLDAELIDKRVRIDDQAALASIMALEEAVNESIESEVDRRQQERLLLLSIIVVTITALTLLQLARRRDQHVQIETARHSSDMEAFTRIAAHDLKGPLNQMSNLVEFIREDIDEGGAITDIEHHLGRIDERITRLNSRIVGVFDYLRAGTSSEPMTSIDLDHLVDEVAATLVDDEVRITIDQPLGMVSGRPAELEAVVANLLSNAIKHHPEHTPSIRVLVKRSRDDVSLHVIDDGPGISTDKREAVFGMYTTLDQLADDQSGVGLAMVKRIVDGWGGSITIGDASPHGADFRVSLPTP